MISFTTVGSGAVEFSPEASELYFKRDDMFGRLFGEGKGWICFEHPWYDQKFRVIWTGEAWKLQDERTVWVDSCEEEE